MTERLQDYAALAGRLGVDAVAIVPGSNFTRMTGRSFHTSERPLVILVPPSGEPAAIVPNLELRSFDLVNFEGPVFDWRDQDGYQGAFEALAKHMPLRRIAVEGQVMRVFVHHAFKAAYPGLEIIDAEYDIAGLRLRKTPDEVAALERALALSEAALAELLHGVRPGQTEKEIEGKLIQLLFHHGAEELSFGPIIAAADNSARPHASARDYALQPGDALLLDFGGRWGGFCADITRTVFLGHASDEAQDVYAAVLAANDAGQAATRAGVTAHDVDDAVISVLEASPYADRIRTKTGHGLGRDVHEAPYIMRGNSQVLEPGMIFTDEPGLYDVDNFGVRIEDVLLVTETGCRQLTSFERGLTVLPL